MQNKQLLKVRNSLLKLEKDFMKLKDRELKDREEKIKREVEQLFYKPSKDDMDNFEEQEINKIRSIKKNWYDQLIK